MRLSPEAGESFLRSAGLDPIRNSTEWDRWQRKLPEMFARGESLRIWAEQYRRGELPEMVGRIGRYFGGASRAEPPAEADYDGRVIAHERRMYDEKINELPEAGDAIVYHEALGPVALSEIRRMELPGVVGGASSAGLSREDGS